MSDAYLGFGIVKAMNYDTQKRGHLFLVSMNTRAGYFLKKMFIAF